MDLKNKTIIGIIEDVTIYGVNDKLKNKLKVFAKIDTGATKSSIDIKLVDSMNLGPIIRTKIIRSAEGSSRRPIVKIKIKFANKIITEEFTVANRSKMKYPVLIGLNILSKGFLIDPVKK
jgi:hypothetical protein